MKNCVQCYREIPDESPFCTYCGADQHRQPYRKIESYLVWSILATLFCCLPFGIVSIVYASGVDNKVAMGDIAGAERASKNAKMWAWISFGCGLAVYVILFIIAAILGSGLMQHSPYHELNGR
jgi:hypothetical protein